MGAETILLGQQGQGWNRLALKPNCAPRYFPISHGWPAEVQGELIWGPTSFASEDDYILTLGDEEIQEIRAGLEHFNGAELEQTLFLKAHADQE
jgi:hypothetical protein